MRRFPPHILILASLVFLLASSTGRSQDNNDLAKRALTLLKERCFSCHGEEGAAEGGLNFILNPPRLVAREIVVPGDALNSKLYRKVKSGDMPLDDDPLTPQEIELLRKWIDSDGPGFKPLPLNRKFISPENTLELIQKDLKEIDSNDQRFHRYFTITHLYNAGIPDSELETYRRALSKLINSLSWGGTIVRPVPIDPARTVLRIDINDFLWTEETWDRILEENPYGVTYDKPAAAYCYKATGTDQPFIRADWFVAKASVPPLYHDILEMPTTDRALEKGLGVDVDHNLEIGRAARAGFNGSGVSQNNRLIERHVADLTRGAYWKSYDFSANSGVQNLFARPLGPAGPNAFEHAGGEIIFNLPNGLQAYLLVDAKGNRIDKGPTEIVGDPKRPDGAVVNGLSCMSCHTRGMIFKDDQIRRAVQGNGAFSAEVRNEVKRLYVSKRDFRRLQEGDAKRFADAVTETGGTVGTTEPILTLALRFEEELDLPLAAAEAGLRAADFLVGLKTSPQLARTLSPLVVPGGTVKRDVYVANFADIIGDLRIGRHGAGTSPPRVKKEKLQVFILAGQSNMVGHANYITIPTLFTAKETDVRELARLVFKDGTEVTRAMVDAQIAKKIERDYLNKQIRDKNITGEDQIKAAREKVVELTAEYDAMTEKIKATFAVSKRVYISAIADRHRRTGPLTVGYGGNFDKIGPELGFGLSLEKKLDAPILLIKTCWGGKSLHYNFRPPSAGPYELNEKEKAGDKVEEITKNVGLNYRMMNEEVHAVLEDIGKHHPEYDATVGYEIAGFVWFQGFNDQFSDPFRDNYRQNMVNFIKDVRKEYQVPKMPFVIGVMGTGITAEKVGANPVSVAQREAAKAPEFKGNVTSVESYEVYALDALEVYNMGWAEHFAEWCVVGSDRPYHYLGSGKFFVRFGDSLAGGMAELLK